MNKKIKELAELRKKAIILENKIAEQKKENLKQLHIRNFKKFKSTCNFLTPFLLSAGLTIGTVNLLGGGLPFNIDQITKNKTYSLEYETNGDVIIDETYSENSLINPFPNINELTIFTPWEYNNNQYIRYKREYNIDKSTQDLFDAILNQNYNYILENLKEYKEETQVINKIEQTEEQKYFFKAKLQMLDSEDVLECNETELQNTIITIIELSLILVIGGVIASFRKFDYLWYLSSINCEYREKIKSVKPMQDELRTIKKKILSLSKEKKGKKNEK